MRRLPIICGKAVRDKVRNEEIRERTEAESIEEHYFERAELALIWSHGKDGS